MKADMNEEKSNSLDNTSSIKCDEPSLASGTSNHLPPPNVLFDHLSRIDSAKRAISRTSMISNVESQDKLSDEKS